MNAFESLVTSLFERQGFWVRSNLKVDLTKAEKREIGRPSSPRWEIDLVAYKGRENQLMVVECKSYLDSRGVSISAFDGTSPEFAERFKLFSEQKLRKVVVGRLIEQLVAAGSVSEKPRVTLCLAAGKIASENDRQLLKEHFTKNGWVLFDDEWLTGELTRISDGGYENEIADVVAKLLLRRSSGLTTRSTRTRVKTARVG